MVVNSKRTYRCLVVTTRPLELESPRVHREINAIHGMNIEVKTLEPFVAYIGEGERKIFLRQTKEQESLAARNFFFFLTLPVASWLSSEKKFRRYLFLVLEPILLFTNFLSETRHLFSLQRAEKPDFILVHNAPDTSALAVSVVSSFSRVPYIYECRDPAPILYAALVPENLSKLRTMVEKFLSVVERKVATRSCATITVGEAMARRLETKYNLKNCQVIYGSTSTFNFARALARDNSKPLGRLVLVLSGAIEAGIFDIDTVLIAITKIRARGFTIMLRIVGTVGQELANRLRTSDVQIVQWKPSTEYRNYLHEECDVGIAPVMATELGRVTTPNKVFDYMAAGLPVIGPSLPGFTEIVKEGVNGFTYTPGSPDSLASVLERFYDPAVLSKMGQNSLAMFEKYFSEEIQMSRFQSLLESVVELNTAQKA